MKRILSEKNLVVVLFVMVLITFSLAQEDSKKMEKMYSGATTATASSFLKQQADSKSSNSTSNSVTPSVSAE
jgi:prephenate dehydratase